MLSGFRGWEEVKKDARSDWGIGNKPLESKLTHELVRAPSCAGEP